MVERDDALRSYVRRALSGYSKLMWGRTTRIIAEVVNGRVVYSRRIILEEVTKCVLLLQAEWLCASAQRHGHHGHGVDGGAGADEPGVAHTLP